MPHPISAVDTHLLFIHTEREGTTIRVQTAWRKQVGDLSLTTLRSHVFYTGKPQVSALRARRLIRQIAVSRPVFYADVGEGLADLDGVAAIGQVDEKEMKRLDAGEQGQPGWAVSTPCSDGKNVYAWFQNGVAARPLILLRTAFLSTHNGMRTEICLAVLFRITTPPS